MYNNKLKRARAALILGGVKPKYVRRTILELGDHYSDLIQRYVQQGMSIEDAGIEAEKQIGDPDMIVNEILSKPELRSRLSAHPRMMFLAAPVMVFILSILALIALMITAVTLIESSGSDLMAFPSPVWIVTSIQSLVFFMNYGLAAILACGFIYLARDRQVPRRLLMMNILIFSLLGSMFSLAMGFPQAPGESGTIMGSISFFGFIPGPNVYLFSYLWLALIKFSIPVMVATVYWWWMNIKDRAFVSPIA